MLCGEQVVTADRGDLVVVPPGLPHAFAAAPGADADILIVITPGVERFEYFRHLERIAYGKVPPESLLEVQELYDTYFATSASWEDARSGRS
ncbi:AraC family ligand binding domain-containing protein [Actinopolymorpha singaporensis]|uniref:AraC family ligand binding domain-containing protein n=1 Tax=Actinopolymorpha singaporensis TaxID=117157 RepID=UPI0018D2D94E